MHIDRRSLALGLGTMLGLGPSSWRAWAGAEERGTYTNPVIPGFYPDPSVCWDGDAFYLVNSSFEYFPGVPVWKSKNLIDWTCVGHCLDRDSQLDLSEVASSDGIYAPTIRFHKGRYFMSTTLKRPGAGFRNFYVHTDNPAGPWSDPVWVNQGGIDPSLFFDDDGKAYWIGNGTGWAKTRGAYISAIDIQTGTLLSGEPKFIWPGSGGAYPEGPHIYKRNGYYYLLVAEGGTSEGHMVTVARSRSIWGPYEGDPNNPILTHRSLSAPIRATGHADLVADGRGSWWAVFLGIRYHDDYHVLGRETNLAPLDWTRDDWPLINRGKPISDRMTVERILVSGLPRQKRLDYDFSDHLTDPRWTYLRNPPRAAIKAETGSLRLTCTPGGIGTTAPIAFVGQRQAEWQQTVATEMRFEPKVEGAFAGLLCRLDDRHYAGIFVGLKNGRLSVFVRRSVGDIVVDGPAFPAENDVKLQVVCDEKFYSFRAVGGNGLTTVGRHEARYLSSEVAGGYTGVVVAMVAFSENPGELNTALFRNYIIEFEN